jgi:protein O-GlcNAc transferase
MAPGITAKRRAERVFDWLPKWPAKKRSTPGPDTRGRGDAAADRVRAGLEHHQAGRLAEADAAYAEVLRRDPGNIDALHFAGVVAHQRGLHDEAARLIGRALALNAANPPAHNNLGDVRVKQGRLDEAVASFERAIALQPDYIDAYGNLAGAWMRLGRPDQALACYARAVNAVPGSAALRVDMAQLSASLGRGDEAIGLYREAIALAPALPEAHAGLGEALRQAWRLDEAADACRQVLVLTPDSAPALASLGNVLKQMNRPDEAADCYRKALAIEPGAVEARYNLGTVLGSLGRDAEALACYREALALDPAFVEARWACAMAQLPAVCDTAAEVEQHRAAFARELGELERWFGPARLALGARAVGVQQPFYLAYQDHDNRALLERYGSLCARIMGEWLREQKPGAPGGARRRSGPIRIGIVSEQLRAHSVWNAIVKGWFRKLDRGRFELDAFYLGYVRDPETEFARSRTAHFRERAGTLRDWVQAIVERQPDVLIYPEIGMDQTTAKLASMRLAPVQVAAWGHPETTGLPTIDHYLSAQDMEPANAGAHYSERLVLLPHLGCCYQPGELVTAAPSIAGLDVAADAPLFVCPGVPFKYAPQHDAVLVRIARALGRCRFVFFTHRQPELSERLRRRLERAFGADGLDAGDFCVFAPWLEPRFFLGLLERADAMLDTIGFSGFNTAMQAVEAGAPVVTMDGRFLRGRLASGVLKRIGLRELIASSADEYAQIAITLGRDAAYRQRLRRQIEAQRRILYDDEAPIRAMEAFLSDAVGR